MLKITLKKEDIFLFFLLIWHLEPAFFSEILIIDSVYFVGRVISSFAFWGLLFMKRKAIVPSTAVLGAFSIEALYLFVSIYYKKDVLAQVMSIFSLMLLIMLDYFLKTSYKSLMRTLFFIFEILVYANLVCVLLYPAGIYNIGGARSYWLFGHANNTIIYIMPAIIIAGIRIDYENNQLLSKKNIRPLLLIMASIATVITIWSAATLVGMFVMLCVLFINRHKVYLTAYHAVIAGLVFFVVINLLQLQNHLFVIIVSLLGRDVTFSARTGIWNRAMIAIAERPLFGYGREFSEITRGRLHFNQAHSRYLNVIYHGGIFAFFLQVFTFIAAVRKLNGHSSKEAQFIIAGIWVWMIQITFETNAAPLFYFVFVLAANIDVIIENNKDW